MNQEITLKDILYRDWIGLLGSAITLGLFIMSVYLVVMIQEAVVSIKSENAAIVVSNGEIKSHLITLQKHVELLQETARNGGK